MEPLVITACPECGNNDVATGFWRGSDWIVCRACGDFRSVVLDPELPDEEYHRRYEARFGCAR